MRGSRPERWRGARCRAVRLGRPGLTLVEMLLTIAVAALVASVCVPLVYRVQQACVREVVASRTLLSWQQLRRQLREDLRRADRVDLLPRDDALDRGAKELTLQCRSREAGGEATREQIVYVCEQAVVHRTVKAGDGAGPSRRDAYPLPHSGEGTWEIVADETGPLVRLIWQSRAARGLPRTVCWEWAGPADGVAEAVNLEEAQP